MASSLYPAIDLARFAQEYGATFRRIEQAHSDHSIGAGEWRLLFGLKERPLIRAELARSVGMDPGQANRAADRLVERGLVVRDDSGQGRAILSLSDEGLVAVETCELERTQEARTVFDKMTEPERARLFLAAQSLAQNLGDTQVEVEITTGETSDIGRLLALTIDARIYAYPGVKPMQVARDLHGCIAKLIGKELIIARYGGILVGGAFLQYFEKTEVAKISFLCVDFECRGIGVGKGLLNACYERAQTKGMQELQVSLPVVKGAGLVKLDPAWQRGGQTTDGRWVPHFVTDRWWRPV